MENQLLYNHIKSLPKSLKKEVVSFMERLISMTLKTKKGKLRPYGLEKGEIHIAPDFDAPLEDFKDYM